MVLIIRINRTLSFSITSPSSTPKSHSFPTQNPPKMAVLKPTSQTLLTTSNQNNLLPLLAPTLSSSLYLLTHLHRLLHSTTIFLLLRTYVLTSLLLSQSLYASQLLLIQTYYASLLLSSQFFTFLLQLSKISYRATEGLRKKLWFEFMVFALGGGNGLILMLFWPGWIVLGGGIGAFRLILG